VAVLAALELRALTRRYGERLALADLTFTLEAGQTLAVLGPNGAGKTTLLRLLATLLRPHSGEIRVLGHALPQESWAVRGRIGLLGHEPLLYRELTARENLAFHAALHGVEADRAEQLLTAVGMERRADEPLRTLSRGMVQRVAVCRALLHDPELLLLDEPRANLDPAANELVEPLIGRASGRTRVIVSHDPAGLLAEADLVLGLVRGRVRLLAEPTARPRCADRALPMSAPPTRTVLSALLRKDLRVELRSFESVPAMALFSVTTFVLFHFGLRQDSLSGDLASGVLWVTLLFASVSESTACSSPTPSRAASTASCSRRPTAARCCSPRRSRCSPYLVILELVAVPAFALLLLEPSIGPALPGLLVVLALADLGVAVIGTLVGALAVRTRARDLLGPLLSLPMLVPVVLGAARATEPLFATHAGALPLRWLAILALYDLVFALIAFALFDFLLED